MSTQSQKYIVVFKSTATQEEIDKYATDVSQNGGEVGHRYGSTLKGFSATIPDSFVSTLEANIAGGPIDYIERDGTVTTQ